MPIRTSLPRPTILATALSAAWPMVALAQGAAPAFTPGTVTDSVVAAVDPDQLYAVYVPTSYDTDHPAPILYVMDPRGRALVGIELFRAPAERLGWIVASSYNTRSDVDQDLDTPALAAMLAETQAHFSVDVRRIYLAGFSGTAHASWRLAQAISSGVAGIIAAGAGTPEGLPPALVPSMPGLDLAFFGTAGRTGFNYEEVYRLDEVLGETGFAHRIVYFDGGHRWMPPELARRGVEWMEVSAMTKGLRAADTALARSFYEADMARADSLAAQDRPLEAYHAFGGIARSYDGLLDVAQPTERAEALGGSQEVRDALRRRRRETEEYRGYDDRIRALLSGLLADPAPPDPADLVDRLGIERLLKRAGGNDRDDALQAGRLLAGVDAMVSFYRPREALRAGRPDIVLALLRAADAIRPGRGGVCLFRARALARLARAEEAVTALRCAVERGVVDATGMAADPDLAPLRGNAEFEELLSSMRRQGAGPPGPG